MASSVVVPAAIGWRAASLHAACRGVCRGAAWVGQGGGPPAFLGHGGLPCATSAASPPPLAWSFRGAQRGRGRPHARPASACAGPTPLPGLDACRGDPTRSVFRVSTTANWLVPGSVMLGRYPGQEPSRVGTDAEARANLAPIVGGGVDVFVCLQDEIPPQGQWPEARPVDGFMPYAPLVGALAPGRDVEYLHFPIVDLGTADDARLRGIVRDVAERVRAGRTVYIHCWGGRGRTGTIAACLLKDLFPGEVAVEDALERLQFAYDARGEGEGRVSPETPEQFDQVRRYYAATEEEATEA